MTDRRALVRAVGSILVLAVPRGARSQRAPALRRIGFLGPGAPETAAELQQAYAPLRQLGWIEGRNLLFERRYANDRAERLRPLAEELVRLEVELIVTDGTPATLAAMSATNTIPIVIRSAGDPVRSGLVASLSRPGGNVTGYAVLAPAIDAKRLELLRELLPGARRIGWLDDPANPSHRATREERVQTGRSLGFQSIFVDVAAPGELANAVAEVARQGGQALLVPPDAMFHRNRFEIMRAALKHALPTAVVGKEFLEAGALISHVNSRAEVTRRCAAFIDRILRGARPSDLPMEQPTQFETAINLGTARALGIAVPLSLELRAEVIR